MNDIIWDKISCYDESYAKGQGINKLTEEDVNIIIENIMARPDFQNIISEEIEDYAGRNK